MQETIPTPGKLSRQNLVYFVNEFTYGSKRFIPNPDDPNPGPPWPWSHIINKAVDRVVVALSVRSNPLANVALNPQPLPPKAHFAMLLAQEVIERAGMLHQVADAFSNGDERGIIIVGGFINRFVDDICPTPPVIRFPHLGWPFPPDPDPHPEWSGLELAIIGTQFQNEARTTSNKDVRKTLFNAAEKLLDVAASRL